MPGLASDGVRCVRKVKDGEAMQQKIAVVDGSVTAYIDDNFVGLEHPFRLGKLAGGNAAVKDHVVIRAGFFDDLAAEGERRRRGQRYTASSQLHAGRCGDVIELSRLGS